MNFAVSNNLLFNHSILGREAKLNTGIYYTYKVREYNVIKYTLTGESNTYTGNPDELVNELSINNLPGGFYALVCLSFAWFKHVMKKFMKTFFIIIILCIVFVFAKYLGQFMI